MSRLKLSIMFATLGQLAVEILVIFRYIPLFFCDFSLHSNVYIYIHEYVNDTPLGKKECVVAISWHHVCYLRATSS